MSDRLESRLGDLVLVGEAILKALQAEKKGDVTVNVPEQRLPMIQMESPVVRVEPNINVDSPAPAPPDVVVNVPQGPARKPCAYELNILEWGGPDRRISKMTFTPIE
jgi:hypothetical protein